MKENGNKLCCKVRVSICRPDFEEGHAFGTGIYMLLKGIRDNGSLNQTAKNMGMAYSRAWSILKQCESELATTFVERHGPRGSTLTIDGDRFIEMYEEMEAAAQKAAADVFCRYRK